MKLKQTRQDKDETVSFSAKTRKVSFFSFSDFAGVACGERVPFAPLGWYRM